MAEPVLWRHYLSSRAPRISAIVVALLTLHQNQHTTGFTVWAPAFQIQLCTQSRFYALATRSFVEFQAAEDIRSSQ